MTRIVSRAEAWEQVYEAFQNINFAAFDFNTVKESLISYLKLYFPESFNDFIETSEFIAILELFAYISELYAYRLDVDAHENFLTQADRKQSILRLAKLISYNVSRNIPARGLVKIQSLKTTENLFDSNGINLANNVIRWNDPNNSNWKEQFNLIMNRVLKQDFGTVAPDERIQVDDVLFELYEWENDPLNNGVFPFSAAVSGETIPMELVPVDLNEFGPLERRPEGNAAFSLLYGNDGLGDGSDTTGFFLFAKQGSLQSQTQIFDGVTPNQTFELLINDINDTDIWINNIDPSNGEIIDDGTVVGAKSGAWQEVDLAHAQNIIFNTNPIRNKFEIETLEDDQIKIIFGDGEFSNIPSGTFDIWFRQSINRNLTIPKNSIVDNSAIFTYSGLDGNTQTLTFGYSLINSIQNGSASEETEHIRRTAPAVYYTQDRMVNNRDYNTFMLQDITILKLRALNRTFAGDSKYISWHDPRETYEDVKLFGDDLAVYFKTGETAVSVINEESASAVFNNYVEPLLSSTDFFTILSSRGVAPEDIRILFTQAEEDAIVAAMEIAALTPPQTIHLFYSIELDEWVFAVESGTNTFLNDLPFSNPAYDVSQVLMIITQPWDGNDLEGEGLIRIDVEGLFNWTVNHKLERIVAHSPVTRFWNTNDGNRVLSFDTLLSNNDEIIVLEANKNDLRTELLDRNWHFNVLGFELVEPNIPSTGLIDIHQLSIMPIDENEDTIPDNMELAELIDPAYILTGPGTINFPFIALFMDIVLTSDTSETIEYWYDGSLVAAPVSTSLIDEIRVIAMGTNTSIGIKLDEYVYFQRQEIDLDTQEFSWIPQLITEEVLDEWINRASSSPEQWKRDHGRFPFNFLWLHRTPRFNLVDPAATNIIDIFIITRAHFTDVNRWLEDKTTIEPSPPTSLDLRSSYNHLLDNAMISDTLILHSGKIKILLGNKSISELQAKIKVIKKSTSTLTNNQIKVKIVGLVQEFFDIDKWEFGETFYFTQLSAKLHLELISDVSSVVLVPLNDENFFGDLYQVNAREDEIFQPHITVNDIEIVESLNPQIIKQAEL